MCTTFKNGPFHTGEIVIIKELNKLDVLLTVSKNGELMFWNVCEKSLIINFIIGCEVTCGEISSDD